jgi:hypothetical protein
MVTMSLWCGKATIDNQSEMLGGPDVTKFQAISSSTVELQRRIELATILLRYHCRNQYNQLISSAVTNANNKASNANNSDAEYAVSTRGKSRSKSNHNREEEALSS